MPHDDKERSKASDLEQDIGGAVAGAARTVGSVVGSNLDGTRRFITGDPRRTPVEAALKQFQDDGDSDILLAVLSQLANWSDADLLALIEMEPSLKQQVSVLSGSSKNEIKDFDEGKPGTVRRFVGVLRDSLEAIRDGDASEAEQRTIAAAVRRQTLSSNNRHDRSVEVRDRLQSTIFEATVSRREAVEAEDSDRPLGGGLTDLRADLEGRLDDARGAARNAALDDQIRQDAQSRGDLRRLSQWVVAQGIDPNSPHGQAIMSMAVASVGSIRAANQQFGDEIAASALGGLASGTESSGDPITDVLRQLDDPSTDLGKQVDGIVRGYQGSLVGPLSNLRRPDPIVSEGSNISRDGGMLGQNIASVNQAIAAAGGDVSNLDLRGNRFGYTNQNLFDELDAMASEDVTRLQYRLAATGFLTREFRQGLRQDGNTVKALTDLAAQANGEGMSWQALLRQVEQGHRGAVIDPADLGGGGGGGGGGGRVFTPPASVAPDYATLAQTVKEKLRTELGRDPDESEMAMLTAELTGWYKELDAANTEVARAHHDGRETSVTDVDPTSRFAELFEERFASALDFQEDSKARAAAKANVDSSFDVITGAARGRF